MLHDGLSHNVFKMDESLIEVGTKKKQAATKLNVKRDYLFCEGCCNVVKEHNLFTYLSYTRGPVGSASGVLRLVNHLVCLEFKVGDSWRSLSV